MTTRLNVRRGSPNLTVEPRRSFSHETWEEAVLGIVRAKDGPVTLQEIYREIERHPLVKPRHTESWSGLELSRFHGRLISVVERLRCCSFESLSGVRERFRADASRAPQAAWFLS